jgi:glycosyltransferase involved in cell wall biosynthesis
MGVNRITILMVMRDTLPPKRPDVLSLFGSNIVKSGINTLLVGQFSDPKEILPWCGGETYGLGRSKGMLMGFFIPFFDFFSIIKAFRKSTVTFLQVRDKIASGIVGCVVAKIANVPFIYWMSFPIVEGYESRAESVGLQKGSVIWVANKIRALLSRFFFYRLVLPFADHIFVQSEAMRDWLTKKGVANTRMTAVPMGVDTSLLQRKLIVPSTDVRLDGRRVITYVGVLAKARNSEFLLDLVLALKESEPTILLVLAGDAASDDERQWIREEIAQRKLASHVLLTGWLSQDKALQYAVRAEVGLSPIPRGELFDVSSPTKLVEYLALGLPGVANDIPDQKLVIERSGAGLCVPMEIDAFRDAVLLLLRDPELHKRCAELGPGFVLAERSYETLAKGVAQTYRSILDNKK